MGNCLVRLDGDDPNGVLMRISRNKALVKESEEEEGLLTEEKLRKTARTEVKIKISKKRLEDLLERAQLENMSLDTLLTHLMKDEGREIQLRRRGSWSPSLQSIPEVD